MQLKKKAVGQIAVALCSFAFAFALAAIAISATAMSEGQLMPIITVVVALMITTSVFSRYVFDKNYLNAIGLTLR